MPNKTVRIIGTVNSGVRGTVSHDHGDGHVNVCVEGTGETVKVHRSNLIEVPDSEKTRFHRLCSQIVDLCGEMSREAVLSNPNLWAETRQMEAVKRAIVVAAVAHTPVLFIGPNADLAQFLGMQVGVASKSVTEVGTDEFAGRRLGRAMKGYPMHVEAPLCPVKGAGGSTASREAVMEVITAARTRMPKNHDLTETARTLWAQACRDIAIPELSRKSIIGVAAACAALNGNPVIDTMDVAEAVNYWLDRR